MAILGVDDFKSKITDDTRVVFINTPGTFCAREQKGPNFRLKN